MILRLGLSVAAAASSASILICAALVAGCGGSGDDDSPGPTAGQGEIGTPLAAANGDQPGIVEPGAEAPEAGVIEGAPDASGLNELAPPDEEALADGAGSCGAVDAVPTAATLPETSQAIRCLLNAERSSRGLGSLSSNGRLRQASAGHSSDMVARKYFQHSSPQGKTMLDRIRASGYIRARSGFTVGENLGWGSGTLASPRALVSAWMNSPAHRANVLQGRYREIGIGLTMGAPSGGVQGAAITATTDFGRIRR